MINGIIKNIPSDFKLITKIKGANISEANKNKFWRIPKNAITFDYVEIGKNSDADFSKEIISFFDETGKLISKTFRENGRNIRQRLYRHEENKKFITDMIFDTTRITEKVSDMVHNLGGVWRKKSEETQWITKIPELPKNGKIPTELHTRKVNYNPQTETIDTITLTQYPVNLGIGHFRKSFITAKFEQYLGKPKLKQATFSKNLKLDFENDKYLKYRFLDFHTEEGIAAFAKGLLEEKGLDILRIKVYPNSPKVQKNNFGYFNPYMREICFSDTLTQKDLYLPEIVDSIAHEVEHAKQFSLIGRRGNGNCDYEFDAFEKLGELKTSEEKEEALKYFIAKGEYSEFGDKYTNNYLEIKAREAGLKTATEFQFPKENFDFFEPFN